jgi:hypothetical protein
MEADLKRDMDLIRQILILLEEHDGDPWSLWDDYEETGRESDRARFSYHVMLLFQGGYIHAVDCSTADRFEWKPVYLTWQGHDFLDSVRDPKIWEQTKNGAAAAGGFTADLLKDLAKGFIKKQVEELTGVKL